MKRISVLILFVLICIAVMPFAACARKEAYLVEGTYECGAFEYKGQTINKITVSINRSNAEDYQKDSSHIIKIKDGYYNAEFELWIDGEKYTKEYKSTYVFKFDYFDIYTLIEDEPEIMDLAFVTQKEKDGYCLKASFVIFDQDEYKAKVYELEQADVDYDPSELRGVMDGIILKKTA